MPIKSYANQQYSVLQIECGRVGADKPAPKAMSMLEIANPELNGLSLAHAMGVSAWPVTTVEEFDAAFVESLASPGPTLMEAML